MRDMKKRILAIVLSCVMACSALPTHMVFAEDIESTESAAEEVVVGAADAGDNSEIVNVDVAETEQPNEPVVVEEPMVGETETSAETEQPDEPVVVEEPMVGETETSAETEQPDKPVVVEEPMVGETETPAKTDANVPDTVIKDEPVSDEIQEEKKEKEEADPASGDRESAQNSGIVSGNNKKGLTATRGSDPASSGYLTIVNNSSNRDGVYQYKEYTLPITYTITASVDGIPLSGSYDCVGGVGYGSEVTFVDGVSTVDLKLGESTTLMLPSGTKYELSLDDVTLKAFSIRNNINGTITLYDNNVANFGLFYVADQYFYYLDDTGKVPECRYFFRGKVGRPYDDIGYNLDTPLSHVMLDDGTKVYYFDPNGDEYEIIVDSGQKVVCANLPMMTTELIGIKYAPVGGVRIWNNFNGSGSWNGEDVEAYTSWSYMGRPRGIFAYAYEPLAIRKLQKTVTPTGDGSKAQFILSTSSDKSKKYTYEHYDTYEYGGVTYENVYKLNGNVVKDGESEDADTFIETDESGSAYILYPMRMRNTIGRLSEAEDKTYGSIGSAYLFETGCVDEQYNPELYRSVYFGDRELSPVFDVNGNEPHVEDNWFYLHYRADVANFSYDNVSIGDAIRVESNISYENGLWPYVIKKVDGESDYNDVPFWFDVYDENDEIVASFSLKNDERQLINSDLIDGLTKDDLFSGKYRIKERETSGWINMSVTGQGVRQADGYAFYNNCYSSVRQDMTFTNRKVSDISISKVYDDSGTNAIIRKDSSADDVYYGIKVHLENVPEPFRSDITVDNGFSKIDRWNGITYSEREDGSIAECFDADGVAEFGVWVKAGETVKIKNLPDGATYSLEEIAMTGYYWDPEILFDISYEGESGTIDGEDVEAVVTNKLKTVDLKLSKQVHGYDDGRVFYILYSATQIVYESYDVEITTEEGTHHFFTENGNTTVHGIIPIRPEDGLVTVTLPCQTAYYIREEVPYLGKEVPAYEELMEYMASGKSSLSGLKIDGSSIFGSALDYNKTGYYESGNNAADQSGTMQYTGRDLTYINASRVVNIEKVDEQGEPVVGAHMQLLFCPPGAPSTYAQVIRDWTTTEDPCQIIVSSQNATFDGKDCCVIWSGSTSYPAYNLILREVEAPEGYRKADDITFSILRKHFSVDYYIDGRGMSQANGWYPYIDTGDGEEKFTLTMTDLPEKNEVAISKQDVNGEEIAGALLTITGRADGADEDIEPITWTSGSDGHENGEDDTSPLKPHVVKLKPGAYTLHEEDAPEGYDLAPDIEFTVNADGSVYIDSTQTDEIIMVDLPETPKHDLNISKVYDDNGTNAVLEGMAENDGIPYFGIRVRLSDIIAGARGRISVGDAYVSNIAGVETPNYETLSTSGKEQPDSLSSYLVLDYETGTYSADFVAWLEAGSDFTIENLPEGASYEITEVYYANGKVPFTSQPEYIFDISYNNGKGTIEEDDVAAIVTNKMKTIDYVISKKTHGYDDGQTFYINLITNTFSTGLKSFDFKCVDHDGVERTALTIPYSNEPGEYYYQLLIPIRDGEQIHITVPTWAYVDDYGEFGVQSRYLGTVAEADILDAFYSNTSPSSNWFQNIPEYLAEMDYSANNIAAPNNGGKSTYIASDKPSIPTSAILSDVTMEWVNINRRLSISKVDGEGNLLGGAKMQIVHKYTGQVYAEWTSSAEEPYVFSPNEWSSIPIGYPLLLREVSSPDGYCLTEDIEFSLQVETVSGLPQWKFKVGNDILDELVMSDKLLVELPNAGSTGTRTTSALALGAMCLIAGLLYRRRKRYML